MAKTRLMGGFKVEFVDSMTAETRSTSTRATTMIAKSNPMRRIQQLDSGGDSKKFQANSSDTSSGCFDLMCSGFFQTSGEVALGATIYPISVPGQANRLEIDVTIIKDPDTGNWWLIYGETDSLGYWPADLFSSLKNEANLVFWGGEVNSPKLKNSHPHTATEMGCGYLPAPGNDNFMHVDDMSGYFYNIYIMQDFDMGLVLPTPLDTYADEDNCYSMIPSEDSSDDPYYYYGGRGRSDNCP